MNKSLYSSSSRLNQPGQFLKEFYRDLVTSRELAGRLLVRNLRAQYRQSLLGYVWLLLNPLATAAIWIFLRSAQVVNFPDVAVPYPVYVITGLFIWQVFLRMLNMPLQQLMNSKALLVRVKFPWEALLLAGIGEVLFEFVLYMVVLLGVSLAFGIHFQWTMLWGLPALFVWLLAGFAGGLLLAPWGLLYDDVSRGLGVATTLLFFVIPIVYATPTRMPGLLLVNWDPLAILFVVTRDLFLTGQTSGLAAFLVVTALSVVLLLASWIVFRLAIPHLLARMPG